ncbi:MAG: hypothetical protein ACO3AV_13105, partial [Ilumatobacteraceae bacterium]
MSRIGPHGPATTHRQAGESDRATRNVTPAAGRTGGNIVSNDRQKALEAALASIDKQFGKGSIMRMGEKGTMAIEAVPT